MTDSRDERLKRISDFIQLMLAGSGFTRVPDEYFDKFARDLSGEQFVLSGLHEVANNLMSNLFRLMEYARLPVTLFNYGRVFQEFYSRLCIEHGKDPSAPMASGDAAITTKIDASVREWLLAEPKRTNTVVITYYDHVGGVAALDDTEFARQAGSVAAAIVIQAWTIFESLAEDLWETALNVHPTTLAAFAGPSALSFDDLQNNAFNVRSRMGTILKRSSKVGFRSLLAIRESYELAFTEQSRSILETLDTKGLRYAAAVRNVFIHKRGRVDKEFFQQTSGIPDVPTLIDGDVFPLSGELCAQLADSCRTCAGRLVNAVHCWIIGHPEKSPKCEDPA